MRLLDLFCGAGGAAVGYHRAGFTDITGVDIQPQPRYPFKFIQADAMTFPLEGYDVIHASPPCQAYSISRNNGCHKGAQKLIAEVRSMLLKTSGKPYVIENVQGAPLHFPFMLCGASFGLKTGHFDLMRHRFFESNLGILAPPCQHRRGFTIGVYGHGTNSYHRKKLGRCLWESEKREAMGIDWMTRAELSQAIPPAYIHWIGQRMMEAMRGER